MKIVCVSTDYDAVAEEYNRIHETWQDPAGLGPPVSDTMDAQKIQNEQQELRAAECQAADAIRLERDGKYGDALRAWRTLLRAIIPALVVDLKVCIDHVYTSRTGLNVFSAERPDSVGGINEVDQWLMQ